MEENLEELKNLGIDIPEVFNLLSFQKRKSTCDLNQNEEKSVVRDNEDTEKESKSELLEKIKSVNEEFKKASHQYDYQIQHYVEIINLKNDDIDNMKNYNKQ